jgi:hypothetical protein
MIEPNNSAMEDIAATYTSLALQTHQSHHSLLLPGPPATATATATATTTGGTSWLWQATINRKIMTMVAVHLCRRQFSVIGWTLASPKVVQTTLACFSTSA